MIDEKQIKEWVAANVQADLTCKVMPNSTREGLAHDGSPCPCLSCYAVRLRVERRELAQMVISRDETISIMAAVALETNARAEKAERDEETARDAYYTKDAELAGAEIQLSALVAAAAEVARWDSGGGLPRIKKLREALDANVPGVWRGKK